MLYFLISDIFDNLINSYLFKHVKLRTISSIKNWRIIRFMDKIMNVIYVHTLIETFIVFISLDKKNDNQLSGTCFIL